uniref:Uncharacterized protein n=1 Tax=Suricata suricatta TaxID=37032 RepID=A0A673VJ90_SURSU
MVLNSLPKMTQLQKDPANIRNISFLAHHFCSGFLISQRLQNGHNVSRACVMFLFNSSDVF